MPAQRKLPSAYLLKRMVDGGMTHAQIAAKYGVGRSAVSAELSRGGFTNPVRYDETIPWRVKLDHSRHVDLWMLRIAYRDRHGLKVTEDEAARFTSWRQRLAAADAVVTYKPDSPDGFYWVKRREGDGEFHRPPQHPSPKGQEKPLTPVY